MKQEDTFLLTVMVLTIIAITYFIWGWFNY